MVHGATVATFSFEKEENWASRCRSNRLVADGFADDESAPEPTKKKRLKKRKLFSSPEVKIVVILDEDVGELIVFDSERGVLDSGMIADEDEQPDIEFNLYDSSNETDEWANWEEEFVSGEDSDDELWLPWNLFYNFSHL